MSSKKTVSRKINKRKTHRGINSALLIALLVIGALSGYSVPIGGYVASPSGGSGQNADDPTLGAHHDAELSDFGRLAVGAVHDPSGLAVGAVHDPSGLAVGAVHDPSGLT